MDEVLLYGDSWLDDHLDDFHANLRNCCPDDWVLHRVLWRLGTACGLTRILGHDHRPAMSLLDARFCVEIREEDVLSPNLPPHPGDPEVQHPGLQTKVRYTVSFLHEGAFSDL